MQLVPGELYLVKSEAIDELRRKYGPFTFVVRVERVDHDKDKVRFTLFSSDNWNATPDVRRLVEMHTDGQTIDETTGTPMSVDPIFHTESRFIYCFDKGTVEAYTQ
ncbi:hypothetical protein F0L74_32150 [Chitinophaga agrisoli]|uniref:Uncharacterized protein n=1 Tax=Chitinophaga agrisoli TaxID=2607653 RepID=A0A5B2VQ03_9BACT|nr:hypothetical protein [Chitinophaga agrisoli]KAA2240790.1 hypothetical protein F0L74_32150 [Chitinophaga agrisoli]